MMPSLKIYALVDLDDNVVLSVFRTLGDALSDYRFFKSSLFCSLNLGVFLFCPQGVCPISDDAAEKAK